MLFQLIYNRSNGLEFYQQNFVLTLGTWHPYKVAVENVFFAFLSTFLGPAYHALFPDHSILVKPKLTHLENLFSMLSRAYPHFRRQLLTAYASADETDPFFTDIQNLHDLFEFFLPLVIIIAKFVYFFLCY